MCLLDNLISSANSYLFVGYYIIYSPQMIRLTKSEIIYKKNIFEKTAWRYSLLSLEIGKATIGNLFYIYIYIYHSLMTRKKTSLIYNR